MRSTAPSPGQIPNQASNHHTGPHLPTQPLTTRPQRSPKPHTGPPPCPAAQCGARCSACNQHHTSTQPSPNYHTCHPPTAHLRDAVPDGHGALQHLCRGVQHLGLKLLDVSKHGPQQQVEVGVLKFRSEGGEGGEGGGGGTGRRREERERGERAAPGDREGEFDRGLTSRRRLAADDRWGWGATQHKGRRAGPSVCMKMWVLTGLQSRLLANLTRHCGQLFSLRHQPKQAGRQAADQRLKGRQPAGSAASKASRQQAAVHWGPLLLPSLVYHPSLPPSLSPLSSPHRQYTHANSSMRSHLGAQPGLDALLAEAVHAGRHRPRVLDDACRKHAGNAGNAGRRQEQEQTGQVGG